MNITWVYDIYVPVTFQYIVNILKKNNNIELLIGSSGSDNSIIDCQPARPLNNWVCLFRINKLLDQYNNSIFRVQ